MRVALVDPSRTVIKMVSRILEGASHEVVPFVDPREALERMKSDHSIDGLITSAELDTMSGVELCWETRLLATDRRPIFIVLMSSNKDHQHIIESLDGGADEFIGKPPFPEELYARLRAGERLLSTQRELNRLATTDPLTGLLNRRACFEIAKDVCVRADAGSPLTAIMLDIDHFKRVNDVYGHDVGDKVICGVAQAAAGESKVVARLGGEEYVLLLEGCALSDAVAVAERIRLKVAGLEFTSDKGVVKVTCSLGVSEWKQGGTIDLMLKGADVALYAAKTGGRNRVVTADPAALLTDEQSGSGVVRSGPRNDRPGEREALSLPGAPLPH